MLILVNKEQQFITFTKLIKLIISKHLKQGLG